MVVEGRRNTCRETERGTTVAIAWPEARRHGGRGLAWISRRKSRRENARQRRLAWISRRKSRRENARQRRLACSRAFLDGVAVVEERNGGGAARDGGRNCREKWRREIAERVARARKKGAAVLSPN
ncbi:hypothetical protein DEO72_LG10g3128 [Vigna unguiculata]|uniref:Uncharacterized protein n=1 Tax=Vigna unguiculata TaxID=3917 RepID=A0A4D6NDE9_VIGUN|nr:hypothetical protein DEO72_LG10g3128 [Vigna unguiculata]